MSRPDNVRYTQSHEWVLLEGDLLTLGITDFAVEHLGDIVYVDLPDVGNEVELGGSILEIESVKAVAEVYSPVSGSVEAVNEALGDDPASLAADCYGEGWLVKLKVSDAGPVEALMDLPAYEKHLETAEPG
jgi:glycine cleavage system H protein